ncbi:YkgJ family cysteine cluster protein [Pararhizobium sp. BT-229]|uniref:YkgJ family cysteine cluster protein n=1 Tax=Pararhizobium sp. BT-229 TaxID=2986923 RepID=UPI0021F7E333|nr:YkgJ family cysteine cluster protein [Pararhizobium sp. BT-229]MCV9964919.1 YkgJ family cysteine cluster protein [Pararhizobium sp. BT-229]
MLANSRDINFLCTACGKCCDSQPQISVREMYSLLDDFVMEASLICQPTTVPEAFRRRHTPAHAAMGQMVANRAVELGGLKTHSIGGVFGYGKELVVTLAGNALGYPHKRRCPVLTSDNKCGIYDRRPATCRYIPGQHLVPMDQQHLAVGKFRELHGKERCDWSSSAPALVRDGVIVEPTMTEAFRVAESDERGDGLLLQSLLDEDLCLTSSEGEISISDFVTQCLQTHEATIPVAIFTMFLDDLRSHGRLPKGYDVPYFKEVAQRQITLCLALIETNLREKDKAARSHTEMLREHLRVNKALLDFH